MAMQPYMMIIGSILVPVTPDKITTKCNGQNSTVELIDGTIINKLNPPGLTTYKFKLLIPRQTNLPFANRLWNGSNEKKEHYTQDYYLKYFSDVFKNNRVVLFTIWRTAIGGGREMGINDGVDASGDGIITNKSVTIESYSIEESADNCMDMEIDIELQEYVGYGTQKNVYTQNTEDGTSVVSTENFREDNKETAEKYTVKKDDCLINICKKELGDPNKWKEVAELNKLENANKIYPGQVLILKKKI